MSSLNLVKAGDATDTPADRRRAEYKAGRRDGEHAATAEARVKANSFLDAMGFALLDLGDAIGSGNEREILARFDIVSRVFKTGIN